MKIIFFGTPKFAVPSLRALKKSTNTILSVVTTPDKKSGRGLILNSSAIKIEAEKLNIPILTPADLSDKNFLNLLKSLKPDYFIVVAFKYLPRMLLKIPSQGSINLHGSLLPILRGAAPINYALLNGFSETGVTTFFLKNKIDTGDILLQKKVDITPNMTSDQLTIELSNKGANLIIDTLDKLFNNTISPTIQNNKKFSLAPKININRDCRINWSNNNISIHNQIRAFDTNPGAFTYLNEKRVKLYNSVLINNHSNLNPGEINYINPYFEIGTGTKSVFIEQIQIEGKVKTRSSDFILGNQHLIGKYFE